MPSPMALHVVRVLVPPAPLARLVAAGALLLALLLAGTEPAAARPAACAAGHVDVDRGTVRTARDATLCLLNRARAQHRLPPLRLNGKLSRAARAHSRDMVRRRYFAHESIDGRSFSQRIHAVRYVPRGASWSLGENIGWGSGSLAAPAALVRAWMRSPGHRANILSRSFRDIGIGIVPGAPTGRHPGGATYTTDFGRYR